MNTSIKKLPKSQMEIWFEVSAGEFEKFFEKAIFEMGKDLEVTGFRKGKAPKEAIEEKIGREKILMKAADLAVKENYLKIILEKEIEAVSQPQIEILKLAQGNPFEFKATFSILPEINLPDYREIASQTARRKITTEEKEVKDTLSWLQKSRAKFVAKNKPAQIKDFVEIEFQSPQIEENRKRHDNFILGEGYFVEGFEEKLVGMSSGEEKEFSLTFPKNHLRNDLAGKRVDFKVKMKSVQRMILPEINDEFAKGLGRFENLTDLERNLKQGIKIEKENRESQRLRQEILEKMARKTKMEIPEVLIKREKERILKDFKKLVTERFKTSFEDYLNKIKKTEKELLDTFSKQAEKKIKQFLILREISKKEKIEVSEQEVKEAINQAVKKYPTVEKAEKELDLDKLKDYYEEAIKNEKTLAKLESFASQS